MISTYLPNIVPLASRVRCRLACSICSDFFYSSGLLRGSESTYVGPLLLPLKAVSPLLQFIKEAEKENV